MKRFAKFLSVLLVLAMCFSLSSPAFALSLPITAEPTVIASNELILSEQDGHIISILGEDLSNGNARFSLLEDGEVVSVSCVDWLSCEITWTKYQNNVATSCEITSFNPPAQTNTVTAGYVNVGQVGYYHYVQGMIMCTNYINWSYSTNTNPNSVCDLNGFYRDVTNFAATIMGIFGYFSTAGALEIANAVLAVLGLSGSPGDFLVPEYLVSCKRTEVVWRAYTASKEKLYQGYWCQVTHPNGTKQNIYEGNYYPTTAISSHNSTLALAPYTYFYPGSDMYEIASWPS